MIEGFMGLPGMGKTYAMTRKAVKFLRKGRDVYANFPLQRLERDRGRVFHFEQLYELFDVRNAVILLDEAGLVAPSGMWKNIPFEVLAHWREHRHHGVELYYTAQDAHDVATALRRVTQFRTECKKYGPFMVQRTTNMKGTEKFGGSLHIFDKSIAARYNTHADVVKQSYIDSSYKGRPDGKGGSVDVHA